MRTARELSADQFRAAYRRAGWSATLAWFTHQRHPRRHVGAIVHPQTFATMRRATLAHLSQELARMDREARTVIAQGGHDGE